MAAAAAALQLMVAPPPMGGMVALNWDGGAGDTVLILDPSPMGETVALNWERGACDIHLSSVIHGGAAAPFGLRQPRPSLCLTRELHVHRFLPDGRPRGYEFVGLPARVCEARRLLSPPRAARAVFADMVGAMRRSGLPRAERDCMVRTMVRYAREVAAWVVRRGVVPLLTEVCAAVHVSVVQEEEEEETMRDGYGDQQLPSPWAAVPMQTEVTDDQLAGVSREEEHDEEGECCAICLERVAGRERQWLPCSHSFHGVCIRGWLRQKTECPLCRLQLTEEAA